MSVEPIEALELNRYDRVKLTEMGCVTELLYMSHKNRQPRIRKLDKDHYYVLGPNGQPVGEVQQFNHFETRASSVNSLRQTFRRLRNVINANVADIDKVRFITLTYRQEHGEPMRDPERLYRDFRNFNLRFKRYCKQQGYGSFEYINTVEPQGSGAWHCHVLYFFEKKAPYLENSVIRNLWGQGFVTVRALRDKVGKACDNVGAYLTAYLGDLDVESAMRARMDITKFECKQVREEGTDESKYYLKGARLCLYPPGMRIIRCSKGVKRPEESECFYFQAKEKVSAATLTFQQNLRITYDDGKTSCIAKRYYNSAITGSQAEVEGCRVDLRTGEVLESPGGLYTAADELLSEKAQSYFSFQREVVLQMIRDAGERRELQETFMELKREVSRELNQKTMTVEQRRQLYWPSGYADYGRRTQKPLYLGPDQLRLPI